MKKSHILKNLELAKPDHIEWIKQGHKLLQGSPQSEIRKPVDHCECGFGKWYESEGRKLVNIPSLKDVEMLHQEIHRIYTAIYYITFDRREKARSTILSGGVEVPVKEKAFRQKKQKQLEKKVIKMVRMLSTVEVKISSMKPQDFDSVWLQ